ncbi:leucine--tRNA ligase [Patescibacteria group bacterium]
MKTFDHTKIEDNWKDKWYENNIYKAVDFSKKPKQYILAELPYPSGEFLHVGHMMRYTVPEIYSRYLRMKGFNVLYPMGWDSYGLPAETYAIQVGKTPKEVTDNAAVKYKQAMKDMGYAIDWDREINTADPKYYKWTQWIFLKLWESGLVEQRDMPVWWCEELGVQADEEVLNDLKSPTGKVTERGGYIVHRKNLKQWVLKITDYAEKLLEGLDEVDYFESVKSGQRNWIGKKEGATIHYPIENTEDEISCFTTRPDTNFGATFIVLAPEHEFSKKVAEENKKVKAYVEQALSKSEMERIEEGKEKTGVFTGEYATNQLNGNRLPIWVSDFVLADFGSGAVVGVPGHDVRDYDFATKFDLDVLRVIKDDKGNEREIEKREDVFEDYGEAINSEFLNGLKSEEAIKKINEHLEETGIGKKDVAYNLRDQIWSRQRYWGDPIPLIHKQDGSVEADYELPVTLPKLDEFEPEGGKAPLEKVPEWFNVKAKDGTPAKRETDTMPTWAGSNWYYIRYIDPQNDEMFADMEKLKYWMPIDKYFGDAGHTTAHLMYSRFWYRFLYDQGLAPGPEPYKWRMSGGLMLGADRKKMSKSRPEYVVDPKDLLESYGADATRLYLSFIGPYEESYPWNENGIKACYRFVKNVFELKNKVEDKKSSKELQKSFHKMLRNITKMIEDLKMNTSVSEMMIFVNKCKEEDFIGKETYLEFLKVMAPFAPFTSEELWQEVSGYKKWKSENSVHLQDWSVYSKKLVVDDEITIPIQVNGKLRDEVVVPNNISVKEIKEMALNKENVKKYIEDKEIKKFIYVKGRIVNIVI